MELTLIRRPDGSLAPYGDESIEASAKIKTGRLVTATVRQMRNYEFHKKVFALVDFAFNIWTDTLPPKQYKGQDVQPNKTRFRKDLTILSGYYEPVFDVRGEMRLEADSISFASMDQETFEKLFSAMIQATLSNILTHTKITEEDVRKHVDTVLQFDQH